MFVNSEIHETAFIESLVKSFPRSSLQVNRLQESDAELLHLPGCETILALTTDSICEEIERNIYDDPYMIGWMTVTVNASDLAAVGAAPIGILLNQTFSTQLEDGYIPQIQRGIADACAAYGMPVLGGDTNYSTVLQMSATAVGVIGKHPPMMRTGCKPGDVLYASGALGAGNTYALSKLSGGYAAIRYKPHARIAEGRMLSTFATCCMDSSDGLFATIDTLMRINDLGFRITRTVEEYVSEDARSICDAFHIPYWFTLAGIHGEYELIFTIAPEMEQAFLTDAMLTGWQPIRIGETIAEAKVECFCNNTLHEIDTAEIRNLFYSQESSIDAILAELMEMENNTYRRVS